MTFCVLTGTAFFGVGRSSGQWKERIDQFEPPGYKCTCCVLTGVTAGCITSRCCLSHGLVIRYVYPADPNSLSVGGRGQRVGAIAALGLWVPQ